MMDYCPHCMAPVESQGHAFCSNCGGDLRFTGLENHLPVGTVLTGSGGLRSYWIGASIGQGGFGITYVALEQNSRRRMAVKEYFPTRCATRGGDRLSVLSVTGQGDAFQSGLNSFLEEARMVAAHEDLPSVVRVIDYFKANNTAYLVMEYLDGVPLHEKMRQTGGRLPARELLAKLPALLRDLGKLHKTGIIHRDISPDNIMWMPDGSLKLLDFGCARSMENGKSMTVLLKHGFAPIEQYRTKGQGPYTDVYALAATIYYCITGQVAPSAVDRLEQDTIQPPTALGAELTAQQESALLWALRVQPQARPQTMEEFASALFAPAQASRQAQTQQPQFQQTQPLDAQYQQPRFQQTQPVNPQYQQTGPRQTWTQNQANNPPAAPKKKSRVPLIAGILALVLAIGIGGTLAARHLMDEDTGGGRSSSRDKDDEDERPSRTPRPTATPTPTPEPTPDPLYYTDLGAVDLSRACYGTSGEMYAFTEDGEGVLISVPAGVSELTIPDRVGPDSLSVTWIDSEALNGADYGIDIHLGADTCYPYDLTGYGTVYGKDDCLSDSWVFACIVANAINENRAGAVRIEPDLDMVRASMVRAREVSEKYDADNRPDGSRWSTALSEQGVSWLSAKGVIGRNYQTQDAVIEAARNFSVEKYVPAISSGDYSGQYYNKLGFGYYKDQTGKYFYAGFVMYA